MKKKTSKPELTGAKAKVNVEAEVSLCERVDINKVVPARFLANSLGWRWVEWEDGKDWNLLVGHCTKRYSIEFKKFWREKGADAFAKWLWENKRANAHEDKQGFIVVWYTNDKKGNSVMWRKRKRASTNILGLNPQT